MTNTKKGKYLKQGEKFSFKYPGLKFIVVSNENGVVKYKSEKDLSRYPKIRKLTIEELMSDLFII